MGYIMDMSWENPYPLVNVYLHNKQENHKKAGKINYFDCNKLPKGIYVVSNMLRTGMHPSICSNQPKTYKSNVSPQRCKPICNISLGASDLFWLQHVFLDVYRILLISCPFFSRWIVHCSSLSPCKAPDYILIIPFVDDHIPLNPIKSHEHYHSPHC